MSASDARRAEPEGLNRPRQQSALPKVALIGAGTIGTAWAVVFARAGCSVRVWDGDAGALERFPARVAAVFEALEGSAIAGLPGGASRITTHTDLAEAVGDVDWVQEQVKEDLAIKQAVLPRLEAAMRADAILATSTSGLSQAALASVLFAWLPGAQLHAETRAILPMLALLLAPFTLLQGVCSAWSGLLAAEGAYSASAFAPIAQPLGVALAIALVPNPTV
jgi:ketopantoate reductase